MARKSENKEILKRREELLSTNLSLSDDDKKIIEILAGKMIEINAGPGEVIIMKNDPSDSLYFIDKGTVRIHDGGHIFQILDDGQIFGEYSLIDSKPRSATATTITSARIYKLLNDDIKSDSSIYDRIILSIIKMLTARLRSFNEMEEKLTNAYNKIMKQKLEIEREKKDIEWKNKEILQLAKELKEHRDELLKLNQELKREKRTVEQQNEEIRLMNEKLMEKENGNRDDTLKK